MRKKCHPVPFYNMNISISAVILITGGLGAEQSAEVFLPWRNTSCQLPSLPDRRYGHVQAGPLLCAGWRTSTRRNCLLWSGQEGGWASLPLTLTDERRYSSLWARGDQLVIMGGWNNAARTSETLSSDGSVTNSSFMTKYKIR